MNLTKEQLVQEIQNEIKVVDVRYRETLTNEVSAACIIAKSNLYIALSNLIKE